MTYEHSMNFAAAFKPGTSPTEPVIQLPGTMDESGEMVGASISTSYKALVAGPPQRRAC